MDLRIIEDKSLIYNTSFLGEYKCSSLALDRGKNKVEYDIGSLETRLNYVSDQENFREGKKVLETIQRLLWAVPTVPDIYGGRPTYQWAALGRCSLFCLLVDKVKSEEVVPKIDDVSLFDRVFDGAFVRDGKEDFVMEEGVVVSSFLLVRSTKSCLGGMMGNSKEKRGEDEEEHGEGDYLTRMDMINEVKHES
ncbi:hypothetical protein Tco_0889514 [Tanacetum coccineum]